MNNFIQYLVPYKGLPYFTCYYSTRRDIQSERNSSRRYIIYLLGFITLLNSAYNFSLMFQHNLSPSVAMMGFAVFHYIDLPTSMYLLPSAAEALSIYYLYLLYFRKNNDCGKGGNVYNKRDSTYMLIYDEPVVAIGGGNENSNKRKCSLKTALETRRLLLIVVNILQVFTLVIDIFVFVSQFNVFIFVKNYLWPIEVWTVDEWLQILAAEVIAILVEAAFFTYLHVCVLIATLGIVQLILIGRQLKKLILLLLSAERKQKKEKWQKFRLDLAYTRFLKKSVVWLRLLCGSANDFISRALTAYLWINCPLSCVLAEMLLIMGYRFDIFFYFFGIAFLLQQWIATFFIHLLVVGVNGKVHKPVKKVMHLLGNSSSPFQTMSKKFKRPSFAGSWDKEGGSNIKSKTTGNFQLHLKLSDYVSAYHVPSEKRYGITYRGFSSLVTMMSFSEFVLLYTQFLMYSYKWFTTNEFLGFEL